MDTGNVDPRHSEAELEPQARLAWAAERITEADASLGAGHDATSAEVKAWIDSIGTDEELPAPHPRPL